MNTYSNTLPSECGSSCGNSVVSSETEPSTLATKETRLVRRTKILMFAVLLAATIVTSYLSYNVLAKVNERGFLNKLKKYTKELASVSSIKTSNIAQSIDDFSLTVASYAIATNATWPFVVMPDFGARGEHFIKLTGTTILAFNIYIYEKDRVEYEKFTVANAHKIIENDTRPPDDTNPPFSPVLAPFMQNTTLMPTPGIKDDSVYAPAIQIYPPSPSFVNIDALSIPLGDGIVIAVAKARTVYINPISDLTADLSIPGTWPTSSFATPIFRDVEQSGEIVGIVTSVMGWHNIFTEILPEDGDSVELVLSDTCGGEVSYRIEGGSKIGLLGLGDYHNAEMDTYEISSPINTYPDIDRLSDIHCFFSIRVYPTAEFYASSKNNHPMIGAIIVATVFVVTCFFFVMYDYLVQKRQDKVETTANRTGAIVTSLFPKSVMKRLEEAGEAEIQAKKERAQEIQDNSGVEPKKYTMLASKLLASRPIADLFPRVTIMFADVSGFTAWASTREPSQVFILLEQTYSVFDSLAKKRGIFKVETVGDCYVAAAGLPEERPDHAEAMARFANDCRNRMTRIVKALEIILGPDTADLQIRVGLHSGQVTGGVLRGEKSRFQLFGDTVNTASRIESAGEGGQIHLSKQTADLLITGGLENWVIKRKDTVTIKGKGILQTFWLSVGRKRHDKKKRSSVTDTLAPKSGSNLSENSSSENSSSLSEENKADRLVDWNVDMLYRQLQQIAAVRDSTSADSLFPPVDQGLLLVLGEKGSTVLDEVKEIIALPSEIRGLTRDPAMIDLGPKAKSQLRDYVAKIAGMYHPNSFHSFEHASHVTQSVIKLISRIVATDQIDYESMKYKQSQATDEMYDHTFGITSDPLTQFACIFSAIIHDVDHLGIPNSQLIKERYEIAALYKNKSVAEQNSVDLAWNLLMEPMYKDLRACIYSTHGELVRFRQLVVNCVMATDIVDKELGAARKARWAKAFYSGEGKPTTKSSELDDINRKATIVIEHLIQASDVSHTMQHWHVYIKWNEKFFHELYKAYLDGRAENDPSIGWYKGELEFYGFYIIPLAKKLADCGVFGVSSDEYLNYALANRAEWERKGEDVVKGYLSKYLKT